MLTVLEVLQKSAEFLGSKGVEHPRLNAELIIGHSLGMKRMQLYLQFERPLQDPELDRIRPLIRRRAQREPIQYVLGETEWGGLRLKTDRRALIPRPETEYLVELIVQAMPSPPGRILDLGTGTGALGLALAKHYDVSAVTAVDRSTAALELARENAAAAGVEARVHFLESDWFDKVPADVGFNLIVANPPYLTELEVNEAAPEVRDFEPRQALIAESEGTADLQKIIAASPRYLSKGGLLALETGIAQHKVLLEWCADAGYQSLESKTDLTGRDRFILARR